MSGKRTKCLRREFRAEYHRSPKGASLERGRALTAKRSNATKRRIALPRVPVMVRILNVWRAVFEWTVTQPSEWRRWKKTDGDVEAFEVRMGWRSWKQIKPRDGYAVVPAIEIPKAA